MNQETTNALPADPGLMRTMGMHAEEISKELAVVSMPVEGNTQPQGLLHGGATAALCETAASASAQAHAQSVSPQMAAVGTQLSISHLRSVSEGKVTARAVAVHLGKTSSVHQVTVTDYRDRLVATALVTNRILDTTPPR